MRIGTAPAPEEQELKARTMLQTKNQPWTHTYRHTGRALLFTEMALNSESEDLDFKTVKQKSWQIITRKDK